MPMANLYVAPNPKRFTGAFGGLVGKFQFSFVRIAKKELVEAKTHCRLKTIFNQANF